MDIDIDSDSFGSIEQIIKKWGHNPIWPPVPFEANGTDLRRK
jgi:hypothetical protein